MIFYSNFKRLFELFFGAQVLAYYFPRIHHGMSQTIYPLAPSRLPHNYIRNICGVNSENIVVLMSEVFYQQIDTYQNLNARVPV
jgi:hypothetical protein